MGQFNKSRISLKTQRFLKKSKKIFRKSLMKLKMFKLLKIMKWKSKNLKKSIKRFKLH